ncbi:MAG: hypothetical protein PVG93_02645, partial [Phycisphaerales bacterium]
MTQKNRRQLYPVNERLFESAFDEPSEIDIFLGNDDDGTSENQKLDLPEIIGILPIRNAVAFPGTVT